MDIDFVGLRKQKKDTTRLFIDLGYSPRTRFNAMQGEFRLIFNDIENERRVDIFLNVFEMSHKLDFSDRLNVDKITLPLADLLLTKLQVFEITEREYKDVISLLKDRDLGNHDQNDTINEDYIAKLTSQDWGLWRTLHLNLERIESSLPNYSLTTDEIETVKGKMDRLRNRIDREPKTFGWKMRARVGDKVKWYEVPEADVEVVDSRPLHERMNAEKKESM
ncbi:MAG: hypothetical protein M1587_06605 [Thaumarchaeota archaeon]|nr:hypothetical protein [Nitrososphaerota archaeon]